jgi:Family of unknown function (DUF6526)
MPPEAQSYVSHRRYIPLFHFIVLPILAANFIVSILFLWRHPGARMAWWGVVMAFALAALAFTVRTMATTLQDRIIRMEETLRLSRLLPDDLKGRVGELSTGQLIALRFCCDTELPDLTRAVLTEPIPRREDIKKRIKTWRSDTGPRA